jgi:tRNA threonylcarbamoyladenosine biosynthesis protein TsaB
MITLAIDTSEARGSVAILRNGVAVARKVHDNGSDYSGWLLPQVERALAEASAKMADVDLLAVSTGPGSFTGLRVGLTSVKAWAEVYKKRIVGVSRLEAMARLGGHVQSFVASCYDAQRGQIFGGLYRNAGKGFERVGDEFVISPDEFVRFVDRQAGREVVTWVTLDPEMIRDTATLQQRITSGDRIALCPNYLAEIIGAVAEEKAARSEFSDPVTLDANYVRRSDAEIFWKGSPAGVR